MWVRKFDDVRGRKAVGRLDAAADFIHPRNLTWTQQECSLRDSLLEL